MCGIAGIVGLPDATEAAARVASMIGSLARRGPDAEGVEMWPGAVLGHKRLSIFDLSDAGRQPMLSRDRRVGVVFNGAIYNFRKLRNELEKSGCAFESQTDTEVLLHGYLKWGLDQLISKLRGMFAFGLWDALDNKLFLVRDRLGVKPLTYSVQNGAIAFASTVEALRVAGFCDQIDQSAVLEFLEFGYVTEQRSIYAEAKKVSPASIIEWHDGSISSRQYWSPPSPQRIRLSFQEAVEEAETLLLSAVESRLQADVPVGALLSGGVDSSLVCWAIKKLGGEIKAYTIGTPGDPWDETADATATAHSLGIDHRVIQMSAADISDVDELSQAYAEPFACASALGMLKVSRGISTTNVKVLLTGDGGDDVFLGYPEHKILFAAEKLARCLPASMSPIWWRLQQAFPTPSPLRRIRSFLNYATGGLGAVANAHDGLPLYKQFGILGERIRDGEIAHRRIPWSTASAREVLSEFLKHDRLGRFVSEYMTKVDGATMHYSLEARSPFLDQELWEFASALPISLRLQGNSLKAILREIARRNIGEAVARGKKRGFGVPVQRWIADHWYEKVRAVFESAVLVQQGWIEKAATLNLLHRTAQSGSVPNQIWYLYVLELWLRRHQRNSNLVTLPIPKFGTTGFAFQHT
ncbi:MAG: asparagine synthase (glutamine-hydrolyzing) [Pyrinomonadaceae bacterium]